MSITQLAAEVLRLDEIITPKPWHERASMLGGYTLHDSVNALDADFLATVQFESNAEAIVTYRTAAPELARFVLAIMPAIEKLRAAIRPSHDHGGFGGGPDDDDAEFGPLLEAAKDVLHAEWDAVPV